MSKVQCPNCHKQTFINLDDKTHYSDEQVEQYECLYCEFLFKVRAYMHMQWEVLEDDDE